MKKILHVDMDAFFASVEQREHPELRGKPIIVGGSPDKRGVVATCSYEARAYGVRSAMSSRVAQRLCPQAIFVPSSFGIYKAVSQQIREIFLGHTDLVEPLSLDEAYLDVTENKREEPSATRLAECIRQEIYETTQLTGSVGVSYCKFLAKIASDINKPNGITVIRPDQAQGFIDQLPIRKFFGIGARTEEKMTALGIKTGLDLRQRSKEELMDHFGKSGIHYYNISRGIDERPVNPNRIRKSFGKETTFDEDIQDLDDCRNFLMDLSQSLADLLHRHDTWGRTLTLKVKYQDFDLVTRSVTLAEGFRDQASIAAHIDELLEKTQVGERAVRLLGLSISNLPIEHEEGHELQLLLPFP